MRTPKIKCLDISLLETNLFFCFKVEHFLPQTKCPTVLMSKLQFHRDPQNSEGIYKIWH